MTSMKKTVIFILVIIASYNIQAQSSQRAKNFLAEVTKKVNNYKNISIDFSYNIQDGVNDNYNQNGSGHIDIQKDLYVLDFMGMKKIFDGKYVYTITSEDQEVTISKYDAESTDNILPTQILTFFNQGYDFQWDILQNVQGQQIQYIKLIPTDSKSGIKEILLGIDNQNKHIYNKIQVNKNGSKSILTVNSFKTDQPISKNHFTFTESMYPGYYINKID